MSITETLAKLEQGNKRFVGRSPEERKVKPESLATGQKPHTIVLTCADSRVPPELLFDADLGELFVIRIAGNTVSDEALGSIEYAVANLGSNVLMVLGHTSCGAVAAAVDVATKGAQLPTISLERTVNPILRSVKKAEAEKAGDLLERSIDLNVENALEALVARSPIVKESVEKNTLKIVGGKYHLSNGQVEFFG